MSWAAGATGEVDSRGTRTWYVTRATAFSIYQTVFYVGIVVCSAVSGWLSGLGSGGWRWAFGLFGAVGILWAFALAFLLRDTPQPVAAAGAAIFGFGFATGVYDSNLYASLLDVVSPRYRAAAVGIFGCGGNVLDALGPADRLAGRAPRHAGVARLAGRLRARGRGRHPRRAVRLATRPAREGRCATGVRQRGLPSGR